MTKKQLASVLLPLGLIGLVVLFLGIFNSSALLILLAVTLLILWIGVYRLTRDVIPLETHRNETNEYIDNLKKWLSEGNRALIILGVLGFIGGASNNSIAVMIIGVILVIGGGWGYKIKTTNKTKEHSAGIHTDHGSAAWATKEEIKRSGLTNQSTGLYIGGDCLRNKAGHLCTIAGSGQGKGVCQIIPSLLVNPFCSYVITDPKGENAFITARFQKSAGQKVYIIDPWNEQEKMGATHGINASGFNPFAFIKYEIAELRDNCEQIAAYLIPDKDAKDPYWNDRARSMIKVLLMHIVTALPESEHNFWTLYKMLRLSGDEWLELLVDLKMNQHEDGLIAIAAEELIGIEKSGSTMAGIKSSAQNATTIFESPQIRRSLHYNDFNPYSLTNGDCTVYVVIPERFLESYSTWLRLVIGLCLKACNSRPNKRVSFLLDEFAVLGKMKDVQRGFAFARGQNIVLWTFVQSLSQLKDNYGEDGMNTFISNAAVFQTFGIKDQFSTEYVSKLLGEGTRSKDTFSYSAGSSSTHTQSSQTFARRVLTPDEVSTSPSIITIADGLRIQLPKMAYFKNPGNDAVFGTDSIKGSPEWYGDFKNRADPAPR